MQPGTLRCITKHCRLCTTDGDQQSSDKGSMQPNKCNEPHRSNNYNYNNNSNYNYNSRGKRKVSETKTGTG